MAFNLEAQTVIESATLELSADELVKLGDAAPHLQAVCKAYAPDLMHPDGRPEEIKALDIVMAFLSSCASMVDQVGVIKPKRIVRRRKSTKAK